MHLKLWYDNDFHQKFLEETHGQNFFENLDSLTSTSGPAMTLISCPDLTLILSPAFFWI